MSAIHDPDFLPGGAKYDDLPGMLAVAAPAPLFLAGEGERSARTGRLRVSRRGCTRRGTAGPDPDDAAPLDAAIDWLLSK